MFSEVSEKISKLHSVSGLGTEEKYVARFPLQNSRSVSFCRYVVCQAERYDQLSMFSSSIYCLKLEVSLSLPMNMKKMPLSVI